MTDHEDFLVWVSPRSTKQRSPSSTATRPPAGDLVEQRACEHPRALRTVHGSNEVEEAFTWLEQMFSECTSYTFELQEYDEVGDMVYTAGLEHASNSANGQPRTFTLRATRCTAARVANGR